MDISVSRPCSLPGTEKEQCAAQSPLVARQSDCMSKETKPEVIHAAAQEPVHILKKRSPDQNLRIKLFYDHSVFRLDKEKFDLINDTILPSAVEFWERALRVRSSGAPIRLSRKCEDNQVFFKKNSTMPYCKNHCEPTTMCGEVRVPPQHLDVSGDGRQVVSVPRAAVGMGVRLCQFPGEQWGWASDCVSSQGSSGDGRQIVSVPRAAVGMGVRLCQFPGQQWGWASDCVSSQGSSGDGRQIVSVSRAAVGMGVRLCQFPGQQWGTYACRVCDGFGRNCKELEAPGGEGIADADFVFYVSAMETERCNKGMTVAYAAHCQQEGGLDRPIAGHANLCPSSISTKRQEQETLLSTVKHEILHALGFSVSLYAFYRDSEGNPLTPRGENGKPILNEE
ncbi:unnamed protein product [Cyprideis torosa]|uniref:Leishmanolysin-like peptidase n=1 Tax=Cyprideis torosa TaxID=163714 RepID=A0A7R8WEP1_9CRUS|nr:unnamed protein product [Cyprideis torosa]CAG0889743.1 unnamed protein product [Cyprideis torosa]